MKVELFYSPGTAVWWQFILGMIVTPVLLGLIGGLGGRWVETLMWRGWGLLLGPVLILLGLVWTGWVPLPTVALRVKPLVGAWDAFALGISHSRLSSVRFVPQR